MKLPRRNFLHLAAGAAALPAVSRFAWAQTYPSRPITIVAPFPAGGATDIVSRTLAEGMKAPLGQTILVENVTGASGTIGSGRVVLMESPWAYSVMAITILIDAYLLYIFFKVQKTATSADRGRPDDPLLRT